MSLTYQESSDLMVDSVFRGRVKVACLTFAAYIQNEAASTPGHSARLRWAQTAYAQPDFAAGQVQQPCVMDSNVQAQGASIDDQTLQTAVEATVNKLL